MRLIILPWSVTHSPQYVCLKHALNHTNMDGDTFTTARVFEACAPSYYRGR